MEELLKLHCTPLTRKERCITHKLWMNLINFKSVKFDSIYMNMIADAVKEIYTQLNDSHFYTYNNFTSSCSAFISILSIYHINKDVKTLTLNKLSILIKYVLLYVYIDHTLDENKEYISDIKSIFYEMMKTPLSDENFIELKNKYKINNIPLQTSINYLHDIIKESPQSIPYIIKAAEIEFETFNIQSDEHDTLKVCYLKGETSAMAGISAMLNDIPPEGTDIMGRLGQLYDDIADLEEDIKCNIKTYVSENYLKYHNIDAIIEIFASEFNKLPTSYNTIKPSILYLLATFLLNNKHISKSIKISVQKYSLLLNLNAISLKEIFYFLKF